MNNLNSAEVITLTAEVKTLSVNNRQITLSVAKQLDQVGAENILPFGRVRLSDGQRVIGKSSIDGSLVISNCLYDTARNVVMTEDFGRKIKIIDVTNKYRRYPWDEYGLDITYNDNLIHIQSSVLDVCKKTSDDDQCCDIVFHDDGYYVKNDLLNALFDRVISRTDCYNAMIKSFINLPLIVLAGLK